MTDTEKITQLRDALEDAAQMIEAEFCSHRGAHSADNEHCSAQFIHEVLRDTE